MAPTRANSARINGSMANRETAKATKEIICCSANVAVPLPSASQASFNKLHKGLMPPNANTFRRLRPSTAISAMALAAAKMTSGDLEDPHKRINMVNPPRLQMLGLKVFS